MSGIDDIMYGSNHDDTPTHSRSPIHGFRRYGRPDWEGSKDVGDDDVGPGDQVEGHAVASCGPAAGEQGFVAETLVEDTADAHDIWWCGQ